MCSIKIKSRSKTYQDFVKSRLYFRLDSPSCWWLKWFNGVELIIFSSGVIRGIELFNVGVTELSLLLSSSAAESLLTRLLFRAVKLLSSSLFSSICWTLVCIFLLNDDDFLSLSFGLLFAFPPSLKKSEMQKAAKRKYILIISNPVRKISCCKRKDFHVINIVVNFLTSCKLTILLTIRIIFRFK